MKARIILLASLALSLIAGNALACGDTLYRVGKGVTYRVYTVPLPGNVLVYGHGDEAADLANHLALSGHDVRFISDDKELQSEMTSGAYDVVIAAYSHHFAIELTTTAAVNAPTYLPVALNADEEALALDHYDRVLRAEKDELKHFLKAIHQTLKQRG